MTMLYRLRKEHIKGSFDVMNIAGKMTKTILRWFRCVERRNNEDIVNKIGVK